MSLKQIQSLNVMKLPNFPNLPTDVRIKVILKSFKIKQFHIIFTFLFGGLNF